MKKTIAALMISALTISAAPVLASAKTHTVVYGDSMWEIAVKYQVGLSEIIAANPTIKNPSMIYPGQKINIPENDSDVTNYEKEVIRLVNEARAKNGLSALTENRELRQWGLEPTA